ncbi:MAG: hypothetical protein GC168_13875 [Candidatus Hydrogenedens sp.]|nr:hypothetical protein [Candidatus Hydrogenedens sp.]
MVFRYAFALLLCAVAMSAAADAPEFDAYGGWMAKDFGAAPWFRTQEADGRWWLVTPGGHAFLSLGSCVVNPRGDILRGTDTRPYRDNVLAKHGSDEGWAEATRERYHAWGLNTLGNWSGEELRKDFPYTVELGVSGGGWGKDSVPDFFDPAVQDGIRERASRVEAYVDDPNLIGYYLDNELPWSTDWRFYPDLFPGYMAMPSEAPGKQRLMAFLQERYEDFAAFARVWLAKAEDWDSLREARKVTPRNRARAEADMEEFVYLAAREYFRNAAEGIRSKDDHHLILGCRFVWVLAPRPVVRACGEFCDVVTINYYEAGWLGKLALKLTGKTSLRIDTKPDLAAFHELTGKPLMVTEFSFRGRESNNPNSFPPGMLIQPTVATQQDRADKFEHYVTQWMSQPAFVGYHWFQWMDEPAGGRAHDGENGNYGLVTIEDEPWPALTDRLRAVNENVWSLHAGE